MSDQLEYLKNEIKNLGGKVFLGFVHQSLYGPLRNLNFILENPNPEYLDHFLLNGQDKIVTDVWKETMLATRLMVLPWEMTYTTEITPPSFASLKEAQAYIRKKLQDNKQKNIDDPFFYRKGTI